MRTFLLSILTTLIILSTMMSAASQDCAIIGIDELEFDIQITPAGPYNTGDIITVAVSVNNFTDLSFFLATILWDPTVLCFEEENGNPSIDPSFPMSISSIGSTGFDQVRNGILPISFLVNDQNVEGLSAPDGSLILDFDLEVCGEGLDCADFSLGDNSFVAHTLPNGDGCNYDNITLNLDADDSFCIECGTELSLINQSYCADDMGNVNFEFSVCGGIAPYTWRMLDGTTAIEDGIINTSGDLAIGNLPAKPPGDPYTLDIRDANGTQLVTGPFADIPFIFTTDFSVINDTLNPDPPLCSYGSGTLGYIITGGGSGPYDIELSDGTRSINDSGTGSFTLLNGDYDITITDSEGCSVTRDIPWDVPPPIEFTIVEQDSATCFGASDGMIRVVATGGLPATLSNGRPGYKFNGGTEFVDTFPIMNPMDGFFFNEQDTCYELEITDSTDLCTTEGGDRPCIKIPLRSALQFRVDNSPITCGEDDGFTSVLTMSRVANYLVELRYIDTTPDSIVRQQVSATTDVFPPGGAPLVLTPGNYEWRIEEVGTGCKADFEFNVPVGISRRLEINTDNSMPASCGASNGVAEVLVIDGTPPYTFEWADFPGQNVSSFNNLAAGTYDVRVIDDLGCSIETTIDLLGTDYLEISIDTIRELDCDDPTIPAQLMVNILPLGASVNILWEDAAGIILSSTRELNILQGGTYTVNVSLDNGNCDVSASASLENTTNITFDIEVTNPVYDCDGSRISTGKLEVIDLQGNTGSVSYLWEGFGLGGLPPLLISDSVLEGNFVQLGQYTLTITDDDSGCKTQRTVTLVPDSELEFAFTISEPTCPGNADGMVTIVGQDLVCYDVDSLLIPGCIYTSLSAGELNVIIEDILGCTKDTTFTLVDPTIFTIELTNIEGTSCTDGADGSAEVAILTNPDGFTQFQYSWNGGSNSVNSVNDLSPGMNTVFVIDDNSCTQSLDFDISEPDQITFNAPTAATDCKDACDAEVNLDAMGGTLTPGNAYSFEWEDGMITAQRDDLCAGTYYITISDDNNCEILDSILITEPDSIIISSVSMNIGCNDDNGVGGTLTLSPTGGCGGPYTYAWPDNLSMTEEARGLDAGDYAVSVTDACGCEVEYTGTITSDGAVYGEALPYTPIECVGELTCIGIDVATVMGGTGVNYTYQINSSGGAIPIDSCVTVGPGNYILTIFDNEACRFTLPAFFVDPAPAFTVDIGSDINADLGNENILVNADITSTFDIDSIEWFSENSYICIDSTADLCESIEIIPIENTSYTVIVTDENGCTTSDELLVNLTANRNVYLPNTFTPGFGTDDKFMLMTGRGVDQIVDFEIFDRWGNLVFALPEEAKMHPTSRDDGWDGTRGDNGREAEQGVYVYMAKVLFADGNVLDYSGHITVIRN